MNSEHELAATEARLLLGERITLTGRIERADHCETLLTRYNDETRLDPATEVPRVMARFLQALIADRGEPLPDRDKKLVVDLGEFIEPMPAGKARAYIETLISEKVWFPDRKTGPGVEKRALERQQRVLAMAAAHLKEGERRAEFAAEERKIEADRAAMTPEQRKAFVQATLAKHRFARVEA